MELAQALFRAWGEPTFEKEYFTVQTVSKNFYGSTWSKVPLFWQKPDEILQFVPREENRCMVKKLPPA